MRRILLALAAVAAALAWGACLAEEAAAPAAKPAEKVLSPAAEVRIEYPFEGDEGWKRAFVAIARHLVAIDEKLVAPEPFHGRRPFVVRLSADGAPRAVVGQREYIVVVIPTKRWYAQLAYQFGHELGHFWIGPDSTSQFQESVCTALSFVTLDELAGYWERNAPADSEEAAWAADLRNYHNWVIFKPQLDRLGLKSVDEAAVWAQKNGPELMKAWDRDKEVAMAKVIERILRRHPGQWGALKQLGNIKGHNEPGMFARWLEQVKPEERPLVEDVAAAFGAPIESRIRFTPPAVICGGRPVEFSGISFKPVKAGHKVAGKLFWRKQGETRFAELALEPAGSGAYRVTVPGKATGAPFEYYLEFREEGEKPQTIPDRGATAPALVVPDLEPPSAVGDLAAPVAKSYGVTLRWKPANDDKKVAEYKVFRDVSDDFKPDEKNLLVALPGDAAEYTDKTPPIKKTAWYAVQAVDVVSREGESKYIKVDVPEPQPPVNSLKLEARAGSKSATISWTGELEPNVAALEIYRAEGKDAPLAKVAEVGNPKETQYVDKDLKGGVEYRYAVRPRSGEGLLAEPGQIVTASPLRYLRRINCGGPAVEAADGVSWEADDAKGNPALRSGGTKVWTVKESEDAEPLKEVYQTERWANVHIQYSIEVEPGRYEVVLYFAETTPGFAAQGKRTFDIQINGQKVAEKVDVFVEAGGAMTPWQFRKVVDVTGRELKVGVFADPVGPAIKGIEIRGLEPAE